ncbi:hypothetical protein C8R45DRAFT_1090884 [Mycena sanguinolenta]|nr:hypothetical protein C8R45DRAFT_1090884 [Mycena sanguinolenta]
MPGSLPQLESLSVILHYLDFEPANSLLTILGHAPRLRRLHWCGPHVPAPWNQLLYLSWHPTDIVAFTAVLPQLAHLTCLRLHFRPRFFDQQVLPEPCIIPQVTEFFFHRHVRGLHTVILPRLRHLVLEKLDSEGKEEQDVGIMHLLDQSLCTLSSFEIHAGASTAFPPLLLLHDRIASTITRLLISSYDLNNFFTALEASSPDTLPEDIRLLRSVDRCFHIHRSDFFPDNDSILALLLRKCFPCIKQLDLDDHFPFDEPFMARTVLDGDTSFVVRRNSMLWREYLEWWKSLDGWEFQDALASRNLQRLSEFEVPWARLEAGPKRNGQNVFWNGPGCW